MIAQILEAILAGVKVGIHSFFSILPFYQQLSDLKTEIIAIALGIPAFLLTIGRAIFTAVRFLRNHA